MSDTHGAAAPAAPQAPAQQSSVTEPTPSDILAFDPFGPSEDPVTPAPQGAGEGDTGKPAEGEGVTQVGADGKPIPQTPAAAAPVPATPAQQAPQADLSQITQAIRDAVQQPQPGAQAQDAPQAPKYNLAIPPQVLTAMRSEDPAEFATGMHAVVNGIANKVWQDQVEYIQKEVFPQITQIVQGHIQSLQQQATVAQEFYGKHTNLAAPALRGMVQQAGIAVAQARQAAGKPLAWSPELADEIAEEVYKVLPQLRPAPVQQPQLGPDGKPVVPKPAARGNGKSFATGTGARPSGTGTPTPADEMMDLIKG